MRATRLACLVMQWLLVTTGLFVMGCAQATTRSGAPARGTGASSNVTLLTDDFAKKQHGPRAPRGRIGGKHPGQDPRQPARELIWDAKGFGANEHDAKQDAIREGREKLMGYLAEEGFSLEWQPSNEFMDGLIKDWTPVKDEEGEDQPVHLKVAGLDDARGWTARFVLGPDKYLNLVAQERQYRAEQRLGILGKGLAGLVALLAAVAGYFRLEEATKGYYTAWLRAGAVAFVGAVGAGLWLLS